MSNTVKLWAFNKYNKPSWYEVFGYGVKCNETEPTKFIKKTVEVLDAGYVSSFYIKDIPSDAEYFQLRSVDERDGDASIIFYKTIEEDNFNYDSQLKLYNEYLELYNKECEKWKLMKELSDLGEKQRAEQEEKELFIKLNKKYG